jgi:hypothetical protein
MLRMKTIAYRGGLVTFRIPHDWLEEYERDGGGTFYEDRPDSGTLRLSTMTMEGQKAADTDDLLAALKGKPADPELLASGDAIVTYQQPTEEGGEAVRMTYWLVANAVEPRHVRIAIFSHTVLAKHANAPATIAEVEMLDHEIRNATFSRRLGVKPS